jgi:hypothetical protein
MAKGMSGSSGAPKRMTDLSIQLKDTICRYCSRQDDEHCSAGVPYYAVSIFCKYFTEGKNADEKKPGRNPSIRRIMKKTLVNTF